MNRRQFLKFNILTGASASIAYAANSHNMHNMHSMNLTNPSNIDTSFIKLSKNVNLIDEKKNSSSSKSKCLKTS